VESRVERRRYTSPTREDAARLTRTRILDAARDSFLTVGYGPTTIRALAAAAEVSEQTIYARFGNKAALLKAVYDVEMAGDDQPIPMADRPHFRRLREAQTLDELLARYAHLARTTAQRMRPLVELVWGNRAADRDLDQLARVAATERRTGATMFAEHVAAAGLLRKDLDIDTLASLVWVLIAPEVYLLHVRDGDATDDQYEQWLTTALQTMLETRAS